MASNGTTAGQAMGANFGFSSDGRYPVIKDATGTVVMDLDAVKAAGSAMDALFITCDSHKTVWGSRCRRMKRPPAHLVNVSIICKTCGRYVEWVR